MIFKSVDDTFSSTDVRNVQPAGAVGSLVLLGRPTTTRTARSLAAVFAGMAGLIVPALADTVWAPAPTNVICARAIGVSSSANPSTSSACRAQR